ncbi:MAG: TspO/MBR family protein [candidate division BRC1 bacterium ADurb.BinA292]|nr:MAG: TspO/MBR family protein [candidate division BRC1 bacterium ADurb.BinA292]
MNDKPRATNRTTEKSARDELGIIYEEGADTPAGRGELGPLALFLVLTGAAGLVGYLLGGGMRGDWYGGLAKPAITPPAAIFGPVWTILYILIAIAGWLVWRRRREIIIRPAMTAWGVQLGLNALWPGLFFGLQRAGWAFLEILALWIAIALTVRQFERIRRAAGWLLAPYLLWVTYAAVLNFAIWRMNP